MSRWPIAGICIFLAAVSWLVFGQTLRHDFVNYDDNKYVYENSQVRSGLSAQGVFWAFTHIHGGNWHPLTSISHMLDCQLYGLKPGGHHFTNVFLHTIGAILLFVALNQMTGALWRSAFVAALFAIHPLHVESVAWVAERKDVLSGVFFMLTLLAYLRYVRKPSLTLYLTMSIFFAGGLLSKPMLVTVPFVLLLLDYWPLNRLSSFRDLRRTFFEKIPLLALSAGSCLATVLAQTRALGSMTDAPISWRISNAFFSVIIYIWQMLWPVKLAAFYPHPLDRLPLGMIAVSIALVLGISIFAILVGRSHGFVLVGWFWYLVMLVPVIGIVQVGLQGHADRYTYLPHIGLYLLVTWGIVSLAKRLPFRRQILGLAAALVILISAWCAHAQTKSWRDTETLWKHAIAVTSNNHFAHSALGTIAFSHGRVEEAIAHFQESLAVYPDSSDTHNRLGLALVQIGDPGAAVAHWKMALQLDPHNTNSEANMAWVFATCPDPAARDGARAVTLIQDAIQRSSERNPITLRTLAAAYAESRRFSEAIIAAQEALDLANAQGNTALATDLRKNIDHYQMDVPLRDPSLANVHLRP